MTPSKGTIVRARIPGVTEGRVVSTVLTWCGPCQRNCRIAVRWPDGRLTRVCLRAVERLDDGSIRLK